MDVAVGDTVYFTKYAPDEIEVDGKDYLIIKVSSILAKEG
jgi:co-chaperonin GroES (HSP10)